MALVVKNPPANTRDVRDAGSIPGSGRSPEKEMATLSHILACRIPREISDLILSTYPALGSTKEAEGRLGEAAEFVRRGGNDKHNWPGQPHEAKPYVVLQN